MLFRKINLFSASLLGCLLEKEKRLTTSPHIDVTHSKIFWNRMLGFDSMSTEWPHSTSCKA